GLPLVADGTRGRDRVPAVPADAGRHRDPAPAAAGATLMRRALPRLVLHAGLVLVAIVTLMPLFWMVSASFMSPGEANHYPPPLLPRAFTLENYRTLFTRLDLARAILNSTVV